MVQNVTIYDNIKHWEERLNIIVCQNYVPNYLPINLKLQPFLNKLQDSLTNFERHTTLPLELEKGSVNVIA